MGSRRSLAVGVVLAALAVAGTCSARPSVTVWAVQPPCHLVAYEPSDWTRIGAVRIPPVLFADPAKLAVNGAGQILGRLDDAHLWLWDGVRAETLRVAPSHTGDALLDAPRTERTSWHWLLGDDARSLYVFRVDAHAWSSDIDPDEFHGDTTTTTFVVAETDLRQRIRSRVIALPNPPCFDSEMLVYMVGPCPEPEIWTRDGVIRSSFVLDRWRQFGPLLPGQTPNARETYTRYRRVRDGWQPDTLEEWDALLDATDDGRLAAGADRDRACCGWSNDVDELALVVGTGRTDTLLAEVGRFGNRDTDMSFGVMDARIAPGGAYAAGTVEADGVAGPGPDTDAAHVDSTAIARVADEAKRMPLARVVPLGRSAHAEAREFPGARVIGWTHDSELLLLESGAVVAVDVANGGRRPTGIHVRSAADVFVAPR